MYQANIVKFGTEDNTQIILVAGAGASGNKANAVSEFCTGKLVLKNDYGQPSRTFE